MSQFADWFAPSLLRTSLTLIVAALLVATCVKWLRLRSPAGEQWAWLLVLVQGVMFASLTVPVPSEWLPQRQPPQPEQTAPAEALDRLPARTAPKAVPLNLQVPERPFDRTTKPVEVDVEPEEAVDPERATPPLPIGTPSLRERWPLWPVLTCSVWLLGIVTIFVNGTARYGAFVRRLRAGAPAPMEWTNEWNRMCESAGLRVAIPLVVAKNLGPALCRMPSGYRLVVPEGTWGKLSPAERSAIFRHELEHFRRGDLWWTLVARLLASVHWFNPFAWLAARRYEAQSEFACDAAAAGDDPAQFSELLVQLAAGKSRRITGVQAVAAGSVYERVQRLLSGASGHAGWRAVVPVILALLVICVVCVRVEAVTDAASVADANRGEDDTDTVEDSAVTPDQRDDLRQLQSLIDRAVDTIKARSLSVDVHTPWQLMHQVLGLGLDGRVRLKHGQAATIGLAEWVRGEFKWRDESIWSMTPQGALAHRFTVPYEYEGHPNQFLSYLAAADVPTTFALVATDESGTASQMTVQDLVDGAKRQVSEKDLPTYTLWALAHYLPIDAEWTSDAGESWSIERLVELQVSQPERAGPYGDNVRRYALALALQKYREQNGIRPDSEPSGVWNQVSREMRDRLDMQPSIRRNDIWYIKRRMTNGVDFAMSRAHDLRGDWEAIHELRWRLVALPAERLHEEWVMEAVSELAEWVVENQKSAAEASELYTAAHVLRIYRERESALVGQTAAPNAGIAQPTTTELAANDADAQPQAESAQSEPVSPPTDVAADEIAGVVVDADGRPVADALVDVWHWYRGNETLTDQDGVFRLKGIDPKELAEVLIKKDGYSPSYFPQQQVGAPGWVVVLSDKSYLEGTITGADGQPAVGAEIRASFGPVDLDGGVVEEVVTLGKVGLDGKYRLYLKPESYDLQIAAPGQGVKRLSNVVVAAEDATPLSVTLERGVRFEARAVDSETGLPIEGFVLFRVRAPDMAVRSDSLGRLVVEDLVPGPLKLGCGGGEPQNLGTINYYHHGPFGRWWSEQAMNEWERKQIDDPETGWQRNFDYLEFDLKVGMPPIEIVVERGVSVTGRVTDPDGNPVEGATVGPAKTGSGNSLTGDTRYSVKTAGDGTYSVVLPASNVAKYNLMVHDGDYQEWRMWANGVREPMQTKPGQLIENYDLQLTRPAVIRGQVTFAGKPAANREVRTHAFDKLENRYYDPTTTTDKDGNFELKFVRAGKHFLQVEPFWLSAEQAPKGSREIEVEAGEVLEGMHLVAAPLNNEPSPALAALKFQARVVDLEGTPIAGASAGIGLLGGAPSNLTSLYAHYAKLMPSFTPPALPESNAEGLIELETAMLVQSRQNTAWIYAVDPAGQRAGTALLNLDDYATADPATTQIIDVNVAPVEETAIRFNFDAIPAQALAESERVMMVSVTRDGIPLQRLLAKDEDVALLLPEGDYQIETYDWYAQRVQSNWKVAAGAASRVEIDLQPSRLGSLVGQPAPEFTQLKPADAANPTLGELKGHIVVLDFWGHWCGPCVASMPNLMQLYDEFKGCGVSVVAVHDDSVESYGKLKTIIEQLQNEQWKGQAIPFPVVLDGGGESAIEGTDIKVNGATTAAYGILSWPTTLVIDRAGHIAGLIGAHDLDSARKRLEELLAEPVP